MPRRTGSRSLFSVVDDSATSLSSILRTSAGTTILQVECQRQDRQRSFFFPGLEAIDGPLPQPQHGTRRSRSSILAGVGAGVAGRASSTTGPGARRGLKHELNRAWSTRRACRTGA